MKNYGKITAKFCEKNGYIYFESDSNNKESELILPIDENDTSFSIDLIRSIATQENKNNLDRQKILKYLNHIINK